MKTNIDHGVPAQHKLWLVIKIANYAKAIGGGDIYFIEFVNIKVIDGTILLKCLKPGYYQFILLALKDQRDQTNEKKENSQIKSFFQFKRKNTKIVSIGPIGNAKIVNRRWKAQKKTYK
jgi:hypothetical protein